MRNQSPYLRLALRLAHIASQEILPRFQIVSIETKEDGSEVTEADRRAEAVMRDLIALEYPSHGILGEEAGRTNAEAEYQWVLDPIDGTAWFTLGIAKFGTLIALLEDRRPILGVVHLPVTDETLFAELGGGCWYRRPGLAPKPVSVDSRIEDLSEALISSAGVHNSEISPEPGSRPFRLTEIIRQAKSFRFVGDCVQHMLVARGMLHAALDPMMEPWDIAALVPCLLEAGGFVSTMEGSSDDVVFGRSLITSCSRKLHDTLLEMLNG